MIPAVLPLRKAVPWVLVGVIVVLMSTTLIEYNQIVSLERGQKSASTIPFALSQTISLPSASIETVTSRILVEITTIVNSTQSRTTTVTVSGYLTTAQICTPQTNSLGACNFHKDGTLDIPGLPQFYYLDITSLGLPNGFVFEGVRFNGTVNNDYCAPHAQCTGPIYACVLYSALIIKSGTSYNMSQCTYAQLVALYASVYVYPKSSPQVGFMWLPDGTVYVLVATTF
jgi:hypothetical protein